ncbi:MAG: hypothetical protein S4CHLAM45_08170 [Chlamydiales bacterium]|nr:hypothetical protein [Chlamydiales bacterium]MCH9620431.1 hypothetical protein [Chlamydiales bacterium]MCH9622923.1 hypothetical protein [Chlamydiales bacterium]
MQKGVFLSKMLFIFLDTETTGLDPIRHRAIEIAFKIVESSVVVASYETVISQPPEVLEAADPESLKINGFTEDLILNGKNEATVAMEIIDLFNEAGVGKKSAIFICQNPSFDRSFLLQLISINEQRAMGWPYHWLDLASMFFAKNPAVEEERLLSKNAIAKELGLPPEGEPHRAMNGVNHLMECFEALYTHV